MCILIKVPGEPVNLTVANVSSVYVISWSPPMHPDGVILGYQLSYSEGSTAQAASIQV